MTCVTAEHICELCVCNLLSACEFKNKYQASIDQFLPKIESKDIKPKTVDIENLKSKH